MGQIDYSIDLKDRINVINNLEHYIEKEHFLAAAELLRLYAEQNDLGEKENELAVKIANGLITQNKEDGYDLAIGFLDCIGMPKIAINLRVIKDFKERKLEERV